MAEAADLPDLLLKAITPEVAWGDSTGAGVKVAVIDSGIDPTHPALAGSVVEGVEVVMEGSSPVVKPCTPADEYGHGTACAGIIKEVAPGVQLYSVKVLGADLRGYETAALEGLSWAIEQGIQVINFSLGTANLEYAEPFHALLDYAYFKGSVVVAAASNVPGPDIPATFSSLISVERRALEDRFTFSYRYGKTIELSAAGVNIEAPWLNGTYKKVSGNSFAAPHVTGLVARMMAKHPFLTPFQIKSVLYAIGLQNAQRAARKG